MMARWFTLILLFGSHFSYADLSPFYSSSRQIVLNASAEDGVIYIPKNVNAADYKRMIQSQLRYSIGQLGWFGSIPQYSWLEIEVGSVEDNSNDFVRVNYTVHGRIAWSKEELRPDSFEMILPARGDAQGLRNFYLRYGEDCHDNDLSDAAEFFYYYYPLKETCPLSEESSAEKGRVVRSHWKLEIHPDNYTDRYPEYDELWKDGKLDITVIFSKNKSDSLSDSDAGIKSYNDTYLQLIRQWGRPTFINQTFTGVPGVRHPVLEMRFKIPQGFLNIHLRLVATLAGTDAQFAKWYEQRTYESDAVMYNGHSGLGINIEKIATMGKFQTGKYQIFFLNGCGTFAYFSEDLFKRHAAANPGYEASKHLDVLTNAFSSYFYKNDEATLTFIKAMIAKREDYLTLLGKIDPRQRILVDGDIDNTWQP